MIKSEVKNIKYWRCEKCKLSRGESNNLTKIYCCQRCCGPMDCWKEDDVQKIDRGMVGNITSGEAWE